MSKGEKDGEECSTKDFFLVVKDGELNLAFVEEIPPTQRLFSDIKAGGTVFRVSLPKNSTQEVPIASYTCHPQLRPIPLVRNNLVLQLRLSAWGGHHTLLASFPHSVDAVG